MLADEITPSHIAILFDSAFATDGLERGGKIRIAHKINEIIEVLESLEMAAIDLVLQIVLPTERQSS